MLKKPTRSSVLFFLLSFQLLFNLICLDDYNPNNENDDFDGEDDEGGESGADDNDTGNGYNRYGNGNGNGNDNGSDNNGNGEETNSVHQVDEHGRNRFEDQTENEVEIVSFNNPQINPVTYATPVIPPSPQPATEQPTIQQAAITPQPTNCDPGYQFDPYEKNCVGKYL